MLSFFLSFFYAMSPASKANPALRHISRVPLLEEKVPGLFTWKETIQLREGAHQRNSYSSAAVVVVSSLAGTGNCASNCASDCASEGLLAVSFSSWDRVVPRWGLGTWEINLVGQGQDGLFPLHSIYFLYTPLFVGLIFRCVHASL